MRRFAFMLILIPGLASAELVYQRGYERVLTPLFQKYCFDCHDTDTQKGKFDLEALKPDFADNQAAQHWIEVMDNLNISEMPPEDKPQPTAKERLAMTKWIAAELKHAQAKARSTGGRNLIRRLTRAEYENTVRDLLGVVCRKHRDYKKQC